MTFPPPDEPEPTPPQRPHPPGGWQPEQPYALGAINPDATTKLSFDPRTLDPQQVQGSVPPEQPQYGQTQLVQPHYGRPQTQPGKDPYGQPQYGQPQYGQAPAQPQYWQTHRGPAQPQQAAFGQYPYGQEPVRAASGPPAPWSGHPGAATLAAGSGPAAPESVGRWWPAWNTLVWLLAAGMAVGALIALG